LLISTAIALTAVLLLTSCAQHGSTTPTAPLTKAAQAIADVAKGLQTVQTVVINANSGGLIDDSTTATILNICKTVNTLGLQASALVRQAQASPTPVTTPAGLLPILQQMAAAVNADLQRGVLSIKDQKTLTTVEAVVTVIQTGLAAAVVAVGGN
jgi:hypothetical protein